MSNNDDLVSKYKCRGGVNVENVVNAEQQRILDELKAKFCLEDLIYLNEHKEVIKNNKNIIM